MSSRFDLCLLLYVIRLAGWLKHCNLSLSLMNDDVVQGVVHSAVPYNSAGIGWSAACDPLHAYALM